MRLGFQGISNVIGSLLIIASGGAILWALVNHEGSVHFTSYCSMGRGKWLA